MCRYWRDSIISTPGNWTIISNSQANLATLSLERAKAAPLEIYLDMEEMRESPQFLDLLIPHLQNTRTLLVDRLSTHEDLFLFSQHPMTNLRSLTLSGGGRADRDRSIDPFESSAYTLRYLKLDRVPLYPSFLDLKTLTELDLRDLQCDLHLDTILDFLEENHSLARATVWIRFIGPSLRSSRRRTAIGNRLLSLRITCNDAMDGQALISSIALSKGAELKFNCRGDYDVRVGVIDVLSGISTSHLSCLISPTFMLYVVRSRFIQLLGPNGTASFYSDSDSNIPFVEFPRLPLTNIRHFRLHNYEWRPPGPTSFPQLTSFPALETLTIESGIKLSHLLSALFSNPSALPSLKTLAFLNCVITEEFMQELSQFASDRKNATLARIHRVIIIHPNGLFPSNASIRKLGERVPIVDVRVAEELPTEL